MAVIRNTVRQLGEKLTINIQRVLKNELTGAPFTRKHCMYTCHVEHAWPEENYTSVRNKALRTLTQYPA